jgi:hypothetical protein
MPSIQNWITPFLGLMLLASAAASGHTDDVALGRQIYLERCASCHGLTGEGDGPVARALTTPPANLRRLSERFGNPLPEDQVARSSTAAPRSRLMARATCRFGVHASMLRRTTSERSVQCR